MPCPASTRLMRRSLSGQRVVTTGASSAVLVQASQDRVALVIGPPAAFDAYVSLRAGAASGNGIRMTPTSPPLVLTLGDHGDMVRSDLYVITPGGADMVTVWETGLPGPIEG